MCSLMMSLPPRAANADKSGFIESMSCDTSRRRASYFAGSKPRGSWFGSRAMKYWIAPLPYSQARLLAGPGGSVGGASPDCQLGQPPTGPVPALFSPPRPQAG